MSEQKRGRGQPRHYEEKKEKVTMRITPTAIANLDKIATTIGISRSELVERIARSEEILRQLTDIESMSARINRKLEYRAK